MARSDVSSGSKAKGKYLPLNPLQVPRFGDIATFSRLPYVPDLKGKDVDVAIVGVPFDGGTTYRPGARFGPRAIRDASCMNRNFNPSLGVGIYEKLNIVDAGDVGVNPINMQSTMKAIEKRVAEVHQAGARAILIGGDHSIVLPDLRAVYKKYGKVTLLHFDAHTDTADTAWGEKYHHGTPIRRAIEEGLITGEKIFQIGIRGPLTSATQEDYSREQGIHTLGIDDFNIEAKREAYFAKLRKIAGNGPCYITFDVDGCDPAFAPGTGTPVVGGLTSLQALQSIRKFKGLNIVGANVVEVSPPYDHADMTSLLASALVFEFLSLMALK